MKLIKVLLYGGCHALILRDLLATHFADAIDATLLVNFELIRSGQAFPYDSLREYDVVFYSPIENKGAYNTEYVVAACRTLGIDAICYPWMEWHGYCPGAVKGDFKNRFQWRYPALAAAAASFETFESFIDYAIEAFPDNVSIDAALATTTALVRVAETRHDMAVRISDFVLEQHRYSRLFLISDHPSLKLYLHVLHQMLKILGVAIGSGFARLEREKQEPQWRWRTPILPRVAKRLDLRFSDTRWIDDEVVPGRSLDLRSYLLLYYHSDSVILGPLGAASMSLQASSSLPAAIDRTVAPTMRLVADRLRKDVDDRDQYRLLEVLSEEAIPLERHQHFAIATNQWRSAWG